MHLRALAIYPRIELLKDQFNRLAASCRLDAIMAANGGRKIRIGARLVTPLSRWLKQKILIKPSVLATLNVQHQSAGAR